MLEGRSLVPISSRSDRFRPTYALGSHRNVRMANTGKTTAQNARTASIAATDISWSGPRPSTMSPASGAAGSTDVTVRKAEGILSNGTIVPPVISSAK